MNPLVLIVDDEPSGREALESVLLSQGYELICAGDGLEALQVARDLQPDVILLDIMMPGIDGYETCRRLRADPLLAEVPIVMVTALDDRESRLHSIEAGADDFITKPIDRTALRARVRTITRLNRYRHLQEERAKLERQLNRITALHTIDLTITATLDLRVTLEVLLQQVTHHLNVDAAAVLLIHPHTRALGYSAGRGFATSAFEKLRPRMGADLSELAMLERRMIAIPDRRELTTECSRMDLLEAENFAAYYSVPLMAKGRLEGFLEVYNRAPLAPDGEWLDFLITLSEQCAVAVVNAKLIAGQQQANDDLMQAYEATIEGWSRALDLRDNETEGHTRRVTRLTLALAEAAGMSPAALMHVRRGALLHDIGKISIPDRILQKPGPLTAEEWQIMRKHPAYAYELLAPIDYLRQALDIPHCHHEKWDGSGYPQGLKGETIPLAARIFAVADVWDALRSDRPYRAGWPDDKVMAYIAEESGKHFDPHAVRLFFNVIQRMDQEAD